MELPIRRVSLVYRLPELDQSDEAFLEGDVVEVETIGGWVMEVDPDTRECRFRRQCFRLGAGAVLTPIRRNSWGMRDAERMDAQNADWPW